jgi:hypothetical protein
VNYGSSGIQSTPSKTGLIDSSLFVVEKRLVRTKIGGKERDTGLAPNFSSEAIERHLGG